MTEELKRGPTLHIYFLNEFRLIYGDSPVMTVNTSRLQSLLAYLVLHRNARQSRQHIAFLFWPDSTERQAYTNLRTSLSRLRRALPDSDRFLYADAQTLGWRPHSSFTLDVADFEKAVAGAISAIDLQEAVDLYRGNLLPGCYEDWVLLERERLNQQFLRCLERLPRLLEQQRQYDTAKYYAREMLRYDPVHEATYRRLMRLHILSNDLAGALRAYHTCAMVLQRELAVEPSPETQEAYQRLLNLETGSDTAAEFQVSLTTRLPLVGRQSEWEILQSAWRSAARGRSRFVSITGEAGIGKTRLTEELIEWGSRQGIPTASARCFAAEGELAYAPVAGWLRADALRATLLALDDVWLVEIARILPELLSEQPKLPRPEPLTESWQRQRLFEALARAVLIGSQPLLLIIDDLQWCDQDSLEWLHYLLRVGSKARLLIMGTVRSEEAGPDHPISALLLELRRNRQLIAIELGPLDATETASLASNVAGREVNTSVADDLYQETEGNPLFVVETVRAGLAVESQETARVSQNSNLLRGPSTPHLQSLPSTVQAVIAARLAHLTSSARDLVSMAATIGRAFTFPVLAQASGGDEEGLVRSLDELWQRRIVREQGLEAYDFSHDKIREVAYAELSTAHRRLLHRRVARALETVHASNLDVISGQVATHYERAGLPEQALPYIQRAGEVARRIYANEQAVDHFTKGLALLKALPDSTERVEKELSLQVALGVALVEIKGYAASEVIDVYIRIQELCQWLGRPPSFPALRALSLAALTKGEVRQAYKLGEQFLSLVQNEQNPGLLAEAHYVLGVTRFWLGEFGPAQEHFTRSIHFYDPQGHRSHVALYAHDPGVICLIRLAFVLWFLGYPGQAMQKCQEALTLAQKLTHPWSLGYALVFATWLKIFCRGVSAIAGQAEEAVALSSKQGLHYWRLIGNLFRGWVRTQQGELEIGIAQMQDSIGTYRATGQALYLPFALALIAQVHRDVGEVDKGLSMLDEALALVDKRGDSWYEAELFRLKGEFLLRLVDTDKTSRMKDEIENVSPEACFYQAIDIARRQRAKSLELRATISLSQLWLGQGKPEKARHILTDIYSWFTEGFNTPDLREAKVLLDQLSK